MTDRIVLTVNDQVVYQSDAAPSAPKASQGFDDGIRQIVNNNGTLSAVKFAATREADTRTYTFTPLRPEHVFSCSPNGDACFGHFDGIKAEIIYPDGHVFEIPNGGQISYTVGFSVFDQEHKLRLTFVNGGAVAAQFIS